MELDCTQRSISKELKTEEISRKPIWVATQEAEDAEGQSPAFAFISEYSRRVKYKRRPDEQAQVVDDVAPDNTVRGEGMFLAKIERCKNKRLQRICVCPLTRWLIFKIAFWPPRCEYFFFDEPPGVEPISRVEYVEDALEMKARKKKLNKLRRANKESIGKVWKFGMHHPCAEDVAGVEAFVLKTARSSYVGCIYIRSPSTPARFTLLYSHPNGSDLSDHLVGVPSLTDFARFYKCDVFSYDYSGFGISTGHASERRMYSDLDALYEHVVTERNVDPSMIVLLGYSIGSAATTDLVVRLKNPPAGVILQAPPTSILRFLTWGRFCFGRSNDRQTCCIDRFVTIDKIGHVQVPVLVIHGQQDRVVTIEHSRAICQKMISRTAPQWVPAAAHDNLENCREVWLRIRSFVKRELGLVGNGRATREMRTANLVDAASFNPT